MFADRFGFTGTGGGGTGDSSCRRLRWRLFKVSSSSFKARELEVVLMALEAGSILMGRKVKLSMSSMVDRIDRIKP